jgi:anti-anti-sigma factor
MPKLTYCLALGWDSRKTGVRRGSSTAPAEKGCAESFILTRQNCTFLAVLPLKATSFPTGHNRCSIHLTVTMHELQIKMRQVSGVEIVEMAGAIDSLAFVDLSAILVRMIAEITPRIVLECSRVTYIGSAQLKELLDFAHMAQARGGDVKCVGMAPTIQQVANLSAMGDLIEFFDDLPQALRSFGGLPTTVL